MFTLKYQIRKSIPVNPNINYVIIGIVLLFVAMSTSGEEFALTTVRQHVYVQEMGGATSGTPFEQGQISFLIGDSFFSFHIDLDFSNISQRVVLLLETNITDRPFFKDPNWYNPSDKVTITNTIATSDSSGHSEIITNVSQVFGNEFIENFSHFVFDFSQSSLEYMNGYYNLIAHLSLETWVYASVIDTSPPFVSFATLNFMETNDNYSIIWEVSDRNPGYYSIFINDTATITDYPWNNGSIVFITAVPKYTTNITLLISDMCGLFVSDTIHINSTVIENLDRLTFSNSNPKIFELNYNPTLLTFYGTLLILTILNRIKY